jgi:hypothetical protein
MERAKMPPWDEVVGDAVKILVESYEEYDK